MKDEIATNNVESHGENSKKTLSQELSNDDESISNLEDLKQDNCLSKTAKEVLDELESKRTSNCENSSIIYLKF